MKKTILFPLALIAATAVNAEAATYNLGQLGVAPVVQFVQVIPGAINDRFDFSLGNTSDTAAAATNHPLYFGLVSVLDIPNLSFSLFDSSDSLINGPVGSGSSVFNLSLSAGSYYAVVTGNTTGSSGGAYSVEMSAQPVPVPPAAWLLGSGLLGVVGVARRRLV